MFFRLLSCTRPSTLVFVRAHITIHWALASTRVLTKAPQLLHNFAMSPIVFAYPFPRWVLNGTLATSSQCSMALVFTSFPFGAQWYNSTYST